MDAKTRRQQAAMVHVHGESIVSLSFFGHSDGHVSMWQHINHAEDYEEIKKLVLAMHSHLEKFIADGAMCPFHPDFHALDMAAAEARGEER